MIAGLGLHIDTVKQYATWVRKASFHQIQRFNDNKRYLYLICFINHQYCLRQDILADILLLSVRNSENAVSKEQKSLAYQYSELYEHAFNLMSNSRTSYKELVKQIEAIVKTVIIPDAEKIIKIDQLLNNYRTQQPENDSNEDEIKDSLGNLQSHNYYSILAEASQKLQNRVANIMRYISFEENDTTIYKAIVYYQAKEGNITKTAPSDFMSIEEQDALEDNNGKFSVSLYKALLYIHVAKALKSGIISLRPSYRYLSLENYLYPFDKWQKNKSNLLKEAELSQFQDASQLLSQLQEVLDEQFKLTNKNIIDGKNTYVKFDNKQKVVITTPKVEKPNMKSIASLFSECKYTPILKVLNDIQQVTDYLSCLRHLSVKDKQVLPDTQMFYAAILALGCNIGVSKIANVSRGISEDVLQNLVNWHISLDNIHLANKLILEFLNKLALSHVYRKDTAKLHTSSDGRKIGVSVESLNACYSYKNFGNGMGISNYSFIDDLNRLFYATAISPDQEHSHVIDGLTHDRLIKSDMHSTDTHGYSDAIFAVMYLLGIDFAPRIKGLKHATLYAFIARKVYEDEGFKILPDRYIGVKLIEEQWDDILRLVATIKLNEVPASQIFKRLNSYSKQHPLYCALKEFGRIIKTIFILRYINDVELRQTIQKQLNRIELSNKFS
ncbi:MAG TPA: Tn3 family transposase, partial [Aquella sp.]|nr:Tn3 family transposase [Aquella sp.]